MILSLNGIITAGKTVVSTLLNSLFAVYKAENNADDSLGVINGTAQGGLTYGIGKVGTAFQFNGTNAYVNLPDNSMNLTGDFTISLWVYYAATGAQTLFANGFYNTTSNVYKGWAIEVNNFGVNNNMVSVFIPKGTITPLNYTGWEFRDTALTLNAWNHILITRVSGVNTYAWINNISQSYNLKYGANPADITFDPIYHTTNKASIGAKTVNVPALYMKNNSKIDELTIWSRQLTSDERDELYNSGAGKFYPFTSLTFDSDAGAFITAATITDSTQQSAINQLVLDLKSANIWTKMKAIYPFVGGTASQHRFNLKDPRTVSGAYYITFNGGVTHSSNGLQFDGATGYANTDLISATTLSLNSTHISIYSRTNSTGNYADIGVIQGGGTSYLQLLPKWSDNVFYGQINDANFSDNTVADSLGLFVGNRQSSTGVKLIKNNTVVTSKTSSSVALPLVPLYLGARNNGNLTIQNHSNRQQAFASIGDGLTDSEAIALYNAVQTFQTTLGRQV